MLGPVDRMKVNHAAERVLHAPGNGGQGILEMAIVIDMNLDKEAARMLGKEICDSLKSHSRVFQNVRLNAIRWKADGDYIKEISAMPFFQTGRYFENYEHCPAQKRLELLAQQLKKFYARSKLILLLTNGGYVVGDRQQLIGELQPFLYRRLVILKREDGGGETGALAVNHGIELMKAEE